MLQVVKVVLTNAWESSGRFDNWRVVHRALLYGQVVVELNQIESVCTGVCTFTYDPTCLERHRVSYPGYLSVRSDLYASAWSAIPPRR